MQRDLICSLILLALAAFYYILARDLGETALSDAVGPAGLPLTYAYVLAVLAVLLGIGAGLRRWLRLTGATEGESEEAEDNDGDDAGQPKAGPARQLQRAAGVAAIGVGYLAAVPVIGYPFAIAVTIGAMAVYQGAPFTRRLILLACAGAAFLFVLFDFVLGVPMPAPWNA